MNNLFPYKCLQTWRYHEGWYGTKNNTGIASPRELCYYHNGSTMSPKDRATYFSMPQGLPFCPAALVSRIWISLGQVSQTLCLQIWHSLFLNVLFLNPHYFRISCASHGGINSILHVGRRELWFPHYSAHLRKHNIPRYMTHVSRRCR
jgi:hypothetical protein